jgi:outer membrane receptor protein involved in Fe transport
VAAAEPVTGRVTDGSGKPIAGAKVTVEGAPTSVHTDAEGNFALDAAPGASLIVERSGYGIGLATAAPVVDDVVLLVEETIQIQGKAPVEAPGSVRIDRASIKRIAGAGNDVVRSMSAMPGVANHPLPLGRSGVVIRGSSPQDSKLLVDGFEVPTIYHDLGFRSVIPVEAIDSLEYIPGGFDVSYGRATSGIASLTTRAGQDDGSQQLEFSAGELGTLVQGSTEGGKYTFAVRRSMIDLLLPSLLPDNLDLSLATVPRYYDGQLRVDRQLSKKWSVRLSSLGSDDVLEVYASKQLEPDKRLFTRKRFLRMTGALKYSDGPWAATLAVSGIAQQFIVERGRFQHLDTTAPALTTRAEAVRSADKWAGLQDVAWKTGGELVTTNYKLDVAWPKDPREGEPIEPEDEMTVSQRFDGNVITNNAAAWTQIGANLDERVRLTAGVRVDAYTRNQDVAVQPRGELAVKLLPNLIARFSAGAYSRPPEHDGELLVRELKGERSTQVISGLAWEPAKGVRLQTSLYYTDRSNLIAHVDDKLVNSGTGTTKGAELLATYDRGKWFGWVAYSYSNSTRVDQPGAERRLFDYDQPHDLNVAASYRFGKWTVSGRFRVVSGMPTTPVRAALYDSDADVYYPHYGDVNSERAPIHHQLDLRIDKSWKWGPVKMTKFFDLQNAYMNQTEVAYYYNFDYSQRGAFRMLPIIPTAGLKGEL